MADYNKACRDLRDKLDDTTVEVDTAADCNIEIVRSLKDYKRATDRFKDSLDDLSDTVHELFG